MTPKAQATKGKKEINWTSPNNKPLCIKRQHQGGDLVVQWLGLSALTVMGPGSILG